MRSLEKEGVSDPYRSVSKNKVFQRKLVLWVLLPTRDKEEAIESYRKKASEVVTGSCGSACQ
jgi:hypothetical protein